MTEPNARDYTLALADAFRCLVQTLDRTGHLRLADLLSAMEKQEASRRLQHDGKVADALANVRSTLGD